MVKEELRAFTVTAATQESYCCLSRNSGKGGNFFPGLNTNSRAVDFVDSISLNFLNLNSLCTMGYVPGFEVLQ